MRDARSVRRGGVAIASAIGLLVVLAGVVPAAAAQRVVLGELYSSEYWPYCPSAVAGVNDLEAIYGTDRFVPLTLYVWSDLYQVPEATARFEWYEGLGIPMFIVDGILWAMGGNEEGSEIDRYLPLVEERLLEPSPLVMTASCSVLAGQVSLTADVTVDEALRGQYENQLDFFVCQEGLGGQSNMVVAMLAPEPFSLTEPGQSVTVQREFALDPAWTLSALRLVVIVQDLAGKEVLQAALVEAPAPTGVPLEDGAAVLAHRAWPNPFGASTTIGFSLPRAGRTSLQVFDLDGRVVRTLLRAPLEAGEHRVVWRGDDQAGQRLATGTYFYRLQFAGGPPRTGRMVLLR